MSFDSHSIERLRELGRQLPQELPKPNSSYKNEYQENKNKRHPIETEKDPQVLFHELMNASPDGEVPSHLMARLKELEAQQLNVDKSIPNGQSVNTPNNKKKTPLQRKIELSKETKEEILYACFDRFLFEDEEEIKPN